MYLVHKTTAESLWPVRFFCEFKGFTNFFKVQVFFTVFLKFTVFSQFTKFFTVQGFIRVLSRFRLYLKATAES